MPTDENFDKEILKKIDVFIDKIKAEILKRKTQKKGDEEITHLSSYITGKTFGFNNCIRDCIDNNSVEAYKACKKRVAKYLKESENKSSANAIKAPSEDFKKLEYLYEKMQRYYNVENLIETKKVDSDLVPLPKNLIRAMSKISEEENKRLGIK